MKIENQDLIEQYYQKVKHLYPGVTFDEFKLSCTTPFVLVRKEMESGELRTIRLKFFGTFLVYPKRVKSILEKMKEDFKNLKLDPKIYFSKKPMLEKFLEKHES